MMQFLVSKIEEIKVTKSSLKYVGSITLDPDLMSEAGLMEYQVVHVNSLTTGARSKTYVLKGEKGDCQINGALSHLFKSGELVHVNAYGFGMPIVPRIISKERVIEILNQ